MILTILTIAAAVMSAASLVLHAVAPHTDSTVDDKLAEAVDEIKALLAAAQGAMGPAVKA